MEITLHTEGWYDASHHLENYVGKCANSHGHTYKVKVWVKGDSEQLDEAGILWDFGTLKKVIDMFDHKCLNDLYSTNSTAEHQCMFIYKMIKGQREDLKFKVRIYEQLAPKESYAECGDF